MSFGYQVLGFGTGKAPFVPLGQHLQTDALGPQSDTPVALADAQEGDIVLVTSGSTSNQSNTLLSGYTSIANNTSLINYAAGSNNYVQGRLSYRILTASDDEVPGVGTGNGLGVFMQYRFPDAVTSISLQDLHQNTGALERPYTAVAGANKFVIRWVAGGAYQATASTLSVGSPQYYGSGNNGSMRITETPEAGVATNVAPTFGGRSFFVTIICN